MMQIDIQEAFRQVIGREAERLKSLDWSSAAMDTAIHLLIPGALIGAGIVYGVSEAGGVQSAITLVHDKVEIARGDFVGFVKQNAEWCAAAGGAIAGAGALLFLQGLKEEHQELRQRYAYAFNNHGHGDDLIDAIQRAWDSVLNTHEHISLSIAREVEWLSQRFTEDGLDGLVKPQDMYNIDRMVLAYEHGLKHAHMEALEDKRNIVGQTRVPNRIVQNHIIDGMTAYFKATRQPEPTWMDKCRYVLSGNPEDLQPSEAALLTSEAIVFQVRRQNRGDAYSPSP